MTTIRNKYLEKINNDFEVLYTMVICQMDIVFNLTNNNKDEERYAKIIQNEVIIDGLEVKIRDEVINSIVLYCPRASDSRKIMSYHDMTAYLERIGDLLLNIADFLREVELQGTLYQAYHEIVLLQFETVKKMTQNAIFAFTGEDENLAKEIIRMDDLVDDNHKEIVHGIPDHFVGKVINKQDMLDALSLSSISYNIERIGDNATNIAEAAIYLMEGKNAKHIHNN